MPRGKIKKLVSDRGFGFIATDRPREDVFFHHSGVVNSGFDDLIEGQDVSYEIDHSESGKKPRAVNVRPD